MSMLAQAIALAAQAHVEQVDKAGQPYVLHPLRMMARLTDEAAQIVAVLHDVVEDTPVTLDDLRAAGFAPAIIEAVDCVTRRSTESYDEFIERLAANPLARQVKLADLEDNMDLRRISQPTAKDFARLERYHRAWRQLQSEVVQSGMIQSGMVQSGVDTVQEQTENQVR